MDIDSSDQNNGRFGSTEDEKKVDEKRSSPGKRINSKELPDVLKPKFAKKNRSKRKHRKKRGSRETVMKGSKEMVTRDEEVTAEEDERPVVIREEDEPKLLELPKEEEEQENRETDPDQSEEEQENKKHRDEKKREGALATIDEGEDNKKKREEGKKEVKVEASKKVESKNKTGVTRKSPRKKRSKRKSRRPRASNGSKESINSPGVGQQSPDQSLQKNVTTNSDSKEQPKRSNKKRGFFKQIIDKTKFWSRKSDCPVKITREILARSYVLPEYDANNPQDFTPDPHQLFQNDDDWKTRLKNHCASREEVFINNRPFWINRTPDDVMPKIKLLVHTGLLAQYTLNNGSMLTALEKRTFYNPKKESLEKLMAVDKTIGVDPNDASKEKELKRIISNTFFATYNLQVYKTSKEARRKIEENELKVKRSKEAKSTSSEEKKTSPAPKVSFNIPEKTCQLNVYSRKERPTAGENRKFSTVDYVVGQYRKPPKKSEPDAGTSTKKV